MINKLRAIYEIVFSRYYMVIGEQSLWSSIPSKKGDRDFFLVLIEKNMKEWWKDVGRIDK